MHSPTHFRDPTMCQHDSFSGDGIVVRIAGLPIGVVRRFSNPELVTLLDEIADVNHRRRSIAESVSATAFDLVPTLAKVARRQLLRLRRDIHNDRLDRLAPIALSANSDAVASELFRSDVLEWVRLATRFVQLEESFDRQYQQAGLDTDAVLSELACDSEFARALQLVAPALQNSISKPGKETSKMLRGRLYSYAMRAALKPTPLTFLSSMCRGRWLTADVPDQVVGDCSIDSACLVARVIPAALQTLLPKIVGLKGNMIVRLSPIVTKSCLETIFLAPANFLQKKRERFVRVPTQGIRAILDAFDRGGDSISLDELRTRTHALNRNADVLDRSLEQLMELGVLTIDRSIDDRDPNFLKCFRTQLDEHSDGPQQELLDSIECLVRAQHQMRGTKEERNVAIADANGAVSTLANCLPAGGASLANVSPLFYEDTIRPKCELELSTSRYENAMRALREFAWILALFDSQVLLHMARAECFDRNADDDVTLMEFFHLWKIEKSRDQFRTRIWEMPDELGKFGGRLKTIFDLQRRTLEMFHSLSVVGESATVSIDDKVIQDLVAEIADVMLPWGKIAHFCQAIPESGNLVWNNSGLGFGKHFARFLLTESIVFQEDTPSSFALDERVDEHLNCDIAGVFGTNVNMRHDVLSHEIVYPGVVSSRPTSTQVCPSEIMVQRSETAPWLTLQHRSRSVPIRVVPVGMLFPVNAPPFYRFVSGFAPTAGSRLSIWERYDQMTHGSASDQVRRYPRLSIDTAVIDRATWRVPGNIVRDTMKHQQSDSARFRSLFDWHKQVGLPTQTFVTTLDNPNFFADQSARSEVSKRWTRQVQSPGIRKPFFLDFSSTVSVAEFTRRIAREVDVLTFREWLPRDDAAFGFDGRRCAELVIEQTFL